MPMELTNSTSVFLDKISVYHFYVYSISNINDLITSGIVTIRQKQRSYIVLADGSKISSVEITQTDYFDHFLFCVSRKGRLYSSMELSVPDDGFHNLNCLTLTEYRVRIALAKQFLLNEYGISVCFDNLKFRTIELNKTIETDYSFPEYRRSLVLMVHLFPGQLRLHEADYFDQSDHPYQATDNKKVIRTFMSTSGKRGLTVKIYDKTEQLKKRNIMVSGNYLRFEITLNDPEKIKKALGGNDVFKLSDTDLQKYFLSFIHENLEAPYSRYYVKRSVALKKILKKHYAPGSRTWVRDVLLELSVSENRTLLPLLLDINELVNLLATSKVISFSCKQTRHAAKKRFLETAQRRTPVFCQHDDVKYQELLSKLVNDIPESGEAA
mgnify:FL=1